MRALQLIDSIIKKIEKIDRIKVEVNTEYKLDAQAHSSSYRGALTAIEITVRGVKPDRVRFLQFVTRQVPDMYSILQNGTYQWEKISNRYTQDENNPKWAVDTTWGDPKHRKTINSKKSCFYIESGGMCERTPNSLAMIDAPGGLYEPDQERAVFATFVIVDDTVKTCILWSSQRHANKEKYYQYERKKSVSGKLPQWAIQVATNDVHTSNDNGFKQEKITYTLPNSLTENPPTEPSARYFLKSDENWLTKQAFPQLFPTPLRLLNTVLNIINPVGSSRLNQDNNAPNTTTSDLAQKDEQNYQKTSSNTKKRP